MALVQSRLDAQLTLADRTLFKQALGILAEIQARTGVGGRELGAEVGTRLRSGHGQRPKEEARRCEDCQEGATLFGLPGARAARWCEDCAAGHPGAARVFSRSCPRAAGHAACEDCAAASRLYGLPSEGHRLARDAAPFLLTLFTFVRRVPTGPADPLPASECPLAEWLHRPRRPGTARAGAPPARRPTRAPLAAGGAAIQTLSLSFSLSHVVHMEKSRLEYMER